MKNIWVFNHYAVHPDHGQWIRHFEFARFADKEKYHISLFTASAIHLKDLNIQEKGNKFVKKTIDGVDFVFVKTSSYHTNGLKRVLNLLQFSWRLLFVSKKKVGELPDAIYASSPHPLTWLSAYIVAKRYKVQFIAETRDLWPETFIEIGSMNRKSIPARILYRIEAFIYKRADKLVFTFEGGPVYLKERSLERENVYNLNNGVDAETYLRNVKEKNYENAVLDDPRIRKVVYAGALGKANGLESLLRVAKLSLKEHGKNVMFLIFGYGFMEDELRAYAQEHNLSNVYFGGAVEKNQIPSILSKSDVNMIMVAPSNLYRFGSSANKLFEYLLAGKPIVSNQNAAFDLIERYQCGIMVKETDDQSLYDAINNVLNLPPSEVNEMSKRAIEVAMKYDYQNLSKQFIDIIEK